MNTLRKILRPALESNNDVIIYKARQIGVSTELVSFGVEQWKKGKNVVFVSTNINQNKSLKQKLGNIFSQYYRAPGNIFIVDGKVVVFTTPQSFDRDILGRRADIVIMDECAWFDVDLPHFIDSIKRNFGSQIILASTRNRQRSQFIELFRKAFEGQINFVPVHLPWFVSYSEKKEERMLKMEKLISKEEFRNEYLCPIYDGEENETRNT